MVWLSLGVLLLALVIRARSVLRRRQDRTLREVRALRLARSQLDADSARLGSQLAGLDLATMTVGATPELARQVRDDHHRALATHASATQLLVSAAAVDDLVLAATALADAHLVLATLLARVQGSPLPQQGPPCFFDPAHGPAATEVTWPADDPAASTLPACASDAGLLAAGQRPDSAMVRLGDSTVRWFEAGSAYDAYAHAWFGTGPVAEAVDFVRRSTPLAEETACEWDHIGWAPRSNGGLGEAPPTVHHRLGQLASGQHLDRSGRSSVRRT